MRTTIKNELLKLVKTKRLWLLVLPIIGIVLTIISQNNVEFAEFYATEIFPILSRIFGTILGYVPFSVGEILLVSLVFFTLFYVIFAIIQSVKKRKIKYIKNFVLNYIAIASVAYFLFVINCGINYNRYSFTYYYGIEEASFTPEQLKDMCIDLISTGAEIRVGMADADFDIDINELSHKTQEDFAVFTENYGFDEKINSPAKPVALSHSMSYTKITGVYFPWTYEANINADITPYTIPFTMLHEYAHQIGFMSENEANFIAWLSGKNSDDDLIKYSAYLMASTYSMNSLYKVDRDLYVEAYQYYSEEQRKDLDENNAYWDSFDTPVAETAEKINDTYLKSNGVEDGVVSYGMVTELLLYDYYK